ncbi:SRPBCC family protein [Actinophytocola sp. NPDC049390]|uniref:SRPBCC family protein n=1 Tax=Actinophytocola sp. NPDC049390 TaxID=3363894 RepID=UPI00379D5ECC
MIIKPKHTMYQTTVLEAGPDTVWAEVRNVLNLVKILFGDTVGDMTWVDGGSPDLVPSRYEFRMLHNGGLVQQEVAGRNEVERSLTYRTTAPVLCLYDYVATYRILPVTNDPGRSFMEYSREFMVTDDAEPEIVESLMTMMDHQISAVRDYFATPKPQ